MRRALVERHPREAFEQACPQHLPVTKYLKTVVEKFGRGGGFPTRK